MTRERIVLQAAWFRILIAVAALVAFPSIYPGLAGLRWLFATYLGLALIEQVLIWRDIGGLVRPTIAGAIDLVMLTFLVQRLGSMSTVAVSLYTFIGMVYALVVSRRIGIGLAVVGSSLYAGVLIAEQLRVIPYGPALPDAERMLPTAPQAVAAGVMLGVLVIGSTALVTLLVHRLNQQRQALESANARLEELSQRDPLTQLFNRRHLLARLEQELARARRGRSGAVVMVDLDRFKRVNDLHGHLRGDDLLRELAAAIRDTTRVTDIAGRYGGDEFVVLLTDTDEASARAVAERLVENVRKVGTAFDAEQPITASVGIAVMRSDDEALGLLRRADEKAYRAKQAGGDRVVV